MEWIKQKLSGLDLLSLASGKWALGLFALFCLYPINSDISASFLEAESYVVEFLGKPLDLKGWEYWPLISTAYQAFTVVSLFVAGAYLHSVTLGRLPIFEPPAPEEGNVTVPPYPYDRHQLQLVVGLQHNQLNTGLVRRPQ